MSSSRHRDYLWLHLRDLPAFRALLRAIEARLLAEVELPRPILDLGCGDGHFASVVFSEHVEVGIDVTPGSLRQARRRGAYHWLILADARSLPFASGVFGSVVSNCVIEHIPAVDDVLAEVSRALATGGTFVFSVPSEYFTDYLLVPHVLTRLGRPSLGRLYGRWFDRLLKHYHRYPPAVWSAKLDSVGLRVMAWQYYLSERATHFFDIGHYYGLPSLVIRKLLGRWILCPRRWNLAWLERWLRTYYEQETTTGGCIFFTCRKGEN